MWSSFADEHSLERHGSHVVHPSFPGLTVSQLDLKACFRRSRTCSPGGVTTGSLARSCPGWCLGQPYQVIGYISLVRTNRSFKKPHQCPAAMMLGLIPHLWFTTGRHHQQAEFVLLQLPTCPMTQVDVVRSSSLPGDHDGGRSTTLFGLPSRDADRTS